MCDASLRIPLQQSFAVWHVGRIASVVDGDPEGTDDDDPGHGRPAGVCEQAHKTIFEGGIQNAAVGGENDSGDAEINVKNVEPGEIVEQYDAEAGENGGADGRVALIQIRLEGAGGFEGLGLATEPLGQEERPNDGDCDIRCHPELGAGAALAGSVAGRKVEGNFAEAIGYQSGKAGTDEPAELLVVGVGDHGFVGDKDDGHGEEG